MKKNNLTTTVAETNETKKEYEKIQTLEEAHNASILRQINEIEVIKKSSSSINQENLLPNKERQYEDFFFC